MMATPRLIGGPLVVPPSFARATHRSPCYRPVPITVGATVDGRNWIGRSCGIERRPCRIEPRTDTGPSRRSASVFPQLWIDLWIILWLECTSRRALR